MAGKYDDMTFKKAFNAARKAKVQVKFLLGRVKDILLIQKKMKRRLQKRKSGAPKKSIKPKKRPGSGEPSVAKPGSLAIEKVTVTKLPAKGPVVGRSLGEREAFSKRMARIEKKMKKDFGDSPSLVDDILRAIRNFRAKQGKPKKKDPRNK